MMPIASRVKAIAAILVSVILVLGLVAPALAAQTDIKITSIEVQGNKNVSTDKILSAVKTKVGDVIPQDKLEEKVKEDLKGIYSTGLIADQVARFATEKDGIKIIFAVTENPKLTGFEFQGNVTVPSKDLIPLMNSKVGEVLNTNSLQEDLDRVLKYYSNKGGSIRIADVNTDKDNKLIVKLVERKIEKIVITGNVKTKTRVIRRELNSQEGQLLDFNKIRAEQRRIFNLGFFDEVTPKLDEGKTPDDVIYTIALKEKKTGTAGGGLGYSATDGLLGYLEVSEQNLLGNAQKLNLRLELGSKGTKTYELGFVEPWLDGNRTSLGVNVYNTETPRNETINGAPVAYSEKRTGGNLTLGRPLDLDSTLSLKFKLENSKSINASDPDFTLPGDGSTRSITLGYSRDTRDNFFNPTSGYQVGGSVEYAGRFLGGDNDFTKYQGNASTYIKAFKNQTVAVRVAGGHITSPEEVPVQEIFRLGGADTLRGYSYGQFQGDTMAYTNLEYRFPIVKAVSGVAFVDTGNAWFSGKGEKPSKLETGAGLGIRLDTPLGLIRLDYGLSKDDSGQTKGKTYFSIGQTF